MTARVSQACALRGSLSQGARQIGQRSRKIVPRLAQGRTQHDDFDRRIGKVEPRAERRLGITVVIADLLRRERSRCRVWRRGGPGAGSAATARVRRAARAAPAPSCCRRSADVPIPERRPTVGRARQQRLRDPPPARPSRCDRQPADHPEMRPHLRLPRQRFRHPAIDRGSGPCDRFDAGQERVGRHWLVRRGLAGRAGERRLQIRERIVEKAGIDDRPVGEIEPAGGSL